MFMDEPGLQWHNQKASIWCFKRKSGIANGKLPSISKSAFCLIVDTAEITLSGNFVHPLFSIVGGLVA